VSRVLFICGRNQLRSPTAEQVFSSWPGMEVASAGLDPSSSGRAVRTSLYSPGDGESGARARLALRTIVR
jgi:predicted protein tyrosine phosphatase